MNSRVGKRYNAAEYLKQISDDLILVEASVRRGQSMNTLIKPTSQSLNRVNLNTWKLAYAAAKNVDSPNRNPMYNVYDNIWVDSTLTSIIDTRILKAMQSKFNIVDEKGNPDPEASKLFEKSWFGNFIKIALKSHFQGFVLIELFNFDEAGELIDVTEVNKYHVKPEKGIVAIDQGDEKGIDYVNGQTSLYYIPVGDISEIGILHKVAPHILAKKYAIGNWSEFNEKFGIPFRTVHSNSIDANRQKQLGIIMEEMGSAGWAVLNENEKVELLSITGTDPTKCFEGLIALLDSEVAMIILGQSSTSKSQNNKGTYGSMKILQDISEDRHEADLVFLKYLINGVLIPRLIQYSPAYKKLANKYFEWDKSEEHTSTETIDLISKIVGTGKYKVPAEYITQRTGIPVEEVTTTDTPPPAAGAKKKALT